MGAIRGSGVPLGAAMFFTQPADGAFLSVMAPCGPLYFPR